MRPTLFELPWLGLPIRGYGLMLMIAFLGGAWWAARRALRVKADPDLVVNLAFVCLLSSVIGARMFYVIHYWERFAGHGLWQIVNVSAGGMEFYGGFIGALIGGTAYLLIKGVSFRLYSDIVAPSIMFGMAAARIGCFLNGCCWGAPCQHELPWAIHFPYSSPAQYRQWEERIATLPAELISVHPSGVAFPFPRDAVVVDLATQAKPGSPEADLVRQLASQARAFGLTPEQLQAEAHLHQSVAVHPAQLYASIDGILLAILLNVLFYRRKRHGIVFPTMLILYALCRIVEEVIRIDNPHDTAGLTISQFISLMMITIGVVWLVIVYRMPLRSPKAVPYVPPNMEEAPKRKGRSAKAR